MSDSPDDVPEDTGDSPVRRGWPLAFWVAIGFGLFCILAGFVIGRYGPSLFPLKAAPAAGFHARPSRATVTRLASPAHAGK